jgi:excisionase family DNA binding protein
MSTAPASRQRRTSAAEKLSYTITGACAVTELARSRIFLAIADGSLASFKIGRRRMITAKALNAFIEKLAQQGEAAE